MYYYKNELYHHGIKGQKWGVRRFQNPDGTLTAAGKKRQAKLTAREAKDREFAKKRYGVSDEDYDKAMQAVAKKKQDSATYKEARKRAAKIMAVGVAAAATTGAISGIAISKIHNQKSFSSSDVIRMLNNNRSKPIYGPTNFKFGDTPVGFIIKK